MSHVIGRVLQVLLQRRTQLYLFFLETRRQAGREALAGTAGKTLQTGGDFFARLLELASQFLAVAAQARSQIRLEGSHCAPSQGNRYQHLHQKGDTESNEHRP